MILEIYLLTTFIVLTFARSPDIVNGSDVDYPGKYPWQCSLRFSNYRGGTTHSCGCSIISRRWVLTAAHCTVDMEKMYGRGSWSVYVGIHDQAKRFGKPKQYQVVNYIPHESYRGTWHPDKGHYHDDITLMYLSSSIEYNEYVQPIEINVGSNAFDQCVITGWGSLEYIGSSAPNVLQEAPSATLTLSECKTMWSPSMITDRHVCAYTGETGACSGDSGGPLSCRNGNGAWKLVGIASFVYDQKCTVKKPTVYVNVSYYADWIKSKGAI